MSFPLNMRYLTTAFLLMLPSAALAADFKINAVCVQGTCPPPSGTSDALQFGQSIPLSLGSNPITFGDGDAYSVTWSYSASYTGAGTFIFVNPMVTYTGASPSVGNDTIIFDMFQSYYDNSPGSWDGVYTETVPLNVFGNVGAGSSASAQLIYSSNGTVDPLPLVGPFGLGFRTVVNSATLSGLTGANLVADYQYTYQFQAGSTPGAGASSPPAGIPEPAQGLPVGLALAGVAGSYAVVLRRRLRYTKAS